MNTNRGAVDNFKEIIDGLDSRSPMRPNGANEEMIYLSWYLAGIASTIQTVPNTKISKEEEFERSKHGRNL